MTPQSNFMVAAPIAPGQEAALRALLATMNSAPGVVDPNNALLPFARFDRLHVARFVILHDETLADFQQYGVTIGNLPVWLVFLGDCDGPSEAMLAQLAALAATGLAQIFEHCEGFGRSDDLLAWMRAHSMTPATQYVNWVGRTVLQIRRGGGIACRIARTVATRYSDVRGTIADRDPPGSWLHPCARMVHHSRHRRQRRLPGLPARSATCSVFRWHWWRCSRSSWSVHRSSCGNCGGARSRIAVIAPRPTPDHVRSLSVLEDHDVTNQFSAFGSVKPGWFRLWTLIFIFWVLSFSTRQIYTRGRLARVGTIHFARWVFMDNHRAAAVRQQL